MELKIMACACNEHERRIKIWARYSLCLAIAAPLKAESCPSEVDPRLRSGGCGLQLPGGCARLELGIPQAGREGSVLRMNLHILYYTSLNLAMQTSRPNCDDIIWRFRVLPRASALRAFASALSFPFRAFRGLRLFLAKPTQLDPQEDEARSAHGFGFGGIAGNTKGLNARSR